MTRKFTIGMLGALVLACTGTSGRAVQTPAPPPPTTPPPPPQSAEGSALPLTQSLALGGLLAAGMSRTTVLGCLAAHGESDAARFPVRPPTRSTAPPVAISGIAGGILVTHELAHACCLKSEVTTHIEGTSVVVSERLYGTPCRCMCSSTIRTSVGLAPGTWDVAVELAEGQAVRRVHSQAFVVR